MWTDVRVQTSWPCVWECWEWDVLLLPLRCCQVAPQSCCSSFHSHQLCTRASPSRPALIWNVIIFANMVVLRYLIVVLFCIFPNQPWYWVCFHTYMPNCGSFMWLSNTYPLPIFYWIVYHLIVWWELCKPIKTQLYWDIMYIIIKVTLLLKCTLCGF